MSVT
jgi:hypothetical protein